MAGLIVKNVPFSSWEEWVCAKSFLFSSNENDQLSGLRLVHIWRCRGSLPAAVESTAQLVEAKLLDLGTDSSRRMWQSAESTRMILALAVLRAVNIVVEPNQQGYYAIPVAQLADKVGLPGWIVELRHDATHRHLPTLALLRSASQFLLEWFSQNYWEIQWKELQTLSLLCIECASDQNVKVFKAHSKQPTFLSNILIPLVLSDIKNTGSAKGKSKVGYRYWLKILSHDEHALDMLKVSILSEICKLILSNSEKASTGKAVLALAAHYQQLVAGQTGNEATPWRELLQSKLNQFTLSVANQVAVAVRWNKSCSTEENVNELIKYLTIQFTSKLEETNDESSSSNGVNSKKRKMIDKEEMNKKSRSTPVAVQRVNHPAPIQDIQILNNYGIWPIGLVAGQTDCSNLWQLTLVDDDEHDGTRR